jgi:hypothetical protein
MLAPAKAQDTGPQLPGSEIFNIVLDSNKQKFKPEPKHHYIHVRSSTSLQNL